MEQYLKYFDEKKSRSRLQQELGKQRANSVIHGLIKSGHVKQTKVTSTDLMDYELTDQGRKEWHRYVGLSK